MKVVFLTNQASYHQMHYARAMVKRLGADNFRIVFQKPTSESRAEMGWKDEYTESYILRFWESDSVRQEVMQWIDQAEVVIQGRFPIKYVRERIKKGKLTFACQERLWKKKPSLKRKIARLPHLYKNYYSVNKSNYHFLAIGAYAAKDLNDMGIFKGRSWQFGYFIDVPEYQVRSSERQQLELLWCARLSPVKQPAKALEIAQGLIEKGLQVHLTMIGDGDLRDQINAEISRLGLQDNVTLTGWQTQEEVFQYMHKADLFLMTSHHGEGWGLVVNEAMSHGCGVIANKELGAAAWLVKDGETGYLYSDDDIAGLIRKIASTREEQLLAIGQQGQRRMESVWSASVAAERSIALFTSLLSEKNAEARLLFSEGPCSAIV